MTGGSEICFFFGAGFSADFGIPTMRPFFEKFVSHVPRAYPNLIETFNQHIDALESTADLETLLSSLNAAVSVPNGLPRKFRHSDLDEWVTNSNTLRSHLLSFIVETCEQFRRPEAMQAVGPSLRKLADGANRLIMFSTNYDRVLEFICEANSIPLADGFERKPGELVNPWRGDFSSKCVLAKLHGSVTWYVDRSQQSPQFMRLDRGYPLPGPEFRLSRDGRVLSPLMILPTLEKDTLTQPYNHLAQLMTLTLAKAKLIVTFGTSLRDQHLAGALSYHGGKQIILVVDQYPQAALARLTGARAIGLQADIFSFFNSSGDRFCEFINNAVQAADLDELEKLTADFADAERVKISLWAGLDESRRNALKQLSRDTGVAAKLKALSSVRGVSHPEVVDAVRRLLKSDSPDIRSAAAGCLGLSGLSVGVPELETVATRDAVGAVRLEASLALQRIGGTDAIAALERRGIARPDDVSILAALQEGAP